MSENTYSFENRIDLSGIEQMTAEVKRQIGKIIIGQQSFIELLTVALLADGHVLIEGVPGIAKTLTAKLLARTVSAGFSRIQFTPDLMPSDVLGTSVYNFKTSEFEFKKGPVFSNIVLIDEINRAPAKTQSALFEVMEERQITIDGQRYEMPPPFFTLATQNPIEHEGTYRLPEAQLDRFLFKIEVQYPTFEEEVQILSGFHQRKNNHNFTDIQPVLNIEQLLLYRQQVKQVLVDEKLLHYIARIVHATRNSKDLYLGGSPRASLAIMTSAKALAAMQGRDFVTPEDIQFMCKPVMRHRLILSPEKEMEGVNTDQVIDLIVRSIEVPR
ncbi:MoxR family ATPase [Sphingobacteriales bacterium UPWRP_1]|nr:magnesium chelatase [Sphingobacteriales bacterium TSM_CSM]PSJ72296.1 MoxR family ATPase [Sphingobacteriales bacterium UPWRP_1]